MFWDRRLKFCFLRIGPVAGGWPMFRASDIYGARPGPRGPALVAANKQEGGAAASTAPSWNTGSGGGWQLGGPSAYGPARTAPIATSPYFAGKGAFKRPPANAYRPIAPVPRATPNTVTVLGGGALISGMEKEIEEEARQVCIKGGFSTPDEVRYVSSSMAFIDFPYIDACRDFLRVTGGQLKIKQRVYKLQHASTAQQNPAEEEAALVQGSEEVATDTLMVRQIGDLDEVKIKKAFQAHVPAVKGIRMMIDRSTRKSKGFCFVSFWSVSEAESAKNRMVAAGSMIDSRKVAISFAKPMTHEQALESDLNARAEQDTIQAQAQQALGGINADMWSNYMKFCEEEKEKEDAAKSALLDSIAAKKKALLEKAAAQAAANKAAAEGEGSSEGGGAGGQSATGAPGATQDAPAAAPPPAPAPPAPVAQVPPQALQGPSSAPVPAALRPPLQLAPHQAPHPSPLGQMQLPPGTGPMGHLNHPPPHMMGLPPLPPNLAQMGAMGPMGGMVPPPMKAPQPPMGLQPPPLGLRPPMGVQPPQMAPPQGLQQGMPLPPWRPM